jgi:predicted MFS family arabinose efflux permease
MEKPGDSRTNLRSLLILFTINLCFFSSNASLNMLPPYLSGLGATKAWIGLFQNIGALVMVFAVGFASPILARLEKKRALLVTYAIAAAAYGAMYFFSDNLGLLLLLRSLTGLTYLCGFTMNSSIAYGLLKPDRRASGIALFGISGIIANPIGSFLGEWLIGMGGHSLLFPLGASFAAIACLLSLTLKRQHTQSAGTDSPHYLSLLRRREYWPLFFLSMVMGGAFSAHSTFLPVFSVERLNFANLSIYFSALSLTAILLRFLGRRLLDSRHEKRLLMVALAFLFSACGQTLLLAHPFQLAVSGVLQGIGHSILYPVLSTVFIHTGPESRRDSLNNAFIGTYTLGTVGLSSALGALGDAAGSFWIFAGMGALVAIALAWMAASGPVPKYRGGETES